MPTDTTAPEHLHTMNSTNNPHMGDYEVDGPEERLIINDYAEVYGNITVKNGATLEIEYSTIQGTINVESGSTLKITTSRILGAVTVVNYNFDHPALTPGEIILKDSVFHQNVEIFGAHTVLIGNRDESDNVGNTFLDKLRVDLVQSSIIIKNNTIQKRLRCFKNTGSIQIDNNILAKTRITSNPDDDTPEYNVDGETTLIINGYPPVVIEDVITDGITFINNTIGTADNKDDLFITDNNCRNSINIADNEIYGNVSIRSNSATTVNIEHNLAEDVMDIETTHTGSENYGRCTVVPRQGQGTTLMPNPDASPSV